MIKSDTAITATAITLTKIDRFFADFSCSGEEAAEAPRINPNRFKILESGL